jgi:hypothetical protein
MRTFEIYPKRGKKFLMEFEKFEYSLDRLIHYDPCRSLYCMIGPKFGEGDSSMKCFDKLSLNTAEVAA